MSGSEFAGLATFVLSMAGVVVTVLFSLVVAAVSMILPFGILFLVFRMMAKTASEERLLLASGTRAPGRIVSLAETGMYINHQPQVRIVVEVAPLDGAPFQTQIDRVVSIVKIPQLQPGAVVEVCYDPAKPKRVLIVGF